jgi:hypothetical protein
VEVEKSKSSYIFGYLVELIIIIWRLIDFFSKSGEFRSFFSWKILPIGQNHIFPVGVWGKFASKRNAAAPGQPSRTSLLVFNFVMQPHWPASTNRFHFNGDTFVEDH